MSTTSEAGSKERDGWLLAALGFAAAAVVLAVVALGYGARAASDDSGTRVSAAAEVPAVQVHLAEFSIEPKTVTVAQGGSLSIMNMGTAAHNVEVEGAGLKSDDVPAGDTGTLALAGLAPGDYTIFCAIPGHKEAGMKAALKVATGGGAAAAPAAGGSTSAAGGAKTMTPAEMDEMMAKATKAFPATTKGLGAQALAPTVLADGTKRFDLTTKVVKWEVEPGKLVDAWTYNGTVPGPTLRVDPGDKVQVVLHNELPESTVIHFHGITVPNAMDGVPDITQAPVKPGASFTYAFTATDHPEVGMYHSHHNAAHQVPNGLAGAFLVGNEPVPAGVTVTQRHVMMLNDSGNIGFSLNGKSFPATEPIVATRGEWVEVQYMNEGEMTHPMHLHGLPQLVIAKDGFPVAQPYPVDTLLVAPGERYTILVHATLPGTWVWHCHILSHAERSDGMFGMVTALIVK